MSEEEKPQPPEKPRLNLPPGQLVFWASCVGLFLELAIIRWVSSEVRVFAFCKNLALVACFLGFGVGCFLWKKGVSLARSQLLLLLFALVVVLPWRPLRLYGPQEVSTVMARMPSMMVWQTAAPEVAWTDFLGTLFAVGWTTALFFTIALIMLPYGQLTASGMNEIRPVLRGYSVNVAGSLTGILLYTLTCVEWLSPFWWFAGAAAAAVWLGWRHSERQLLVGLAIALGLVFMPNNSPQRQTTWSNYQKLTLADHRHIWVNNVGYQDMWHMPLEKDPEIVERFNMPYHLRKPPGKVLIVGAGSGNDASAALVAGAKEVTAVEIDEAIYRIGQKYHPNQPYRDPRVWVVLDDARHFLKTTQEKYDVIVFSHLDSHTVLSSFTNVRLDNYIYTVESFAEARSRLAPGGILYVSFYSEQPFIGPRLYHNLTNAFGHAPVFIEGSRPGEQEDYWRNLHFLIGEPEVMPEIEAEVPTWDGYKLITNPDPTIIASTDAWPFLPLLNRQIPPIMLLISVTILLVSVVLVQPNRPREDRFDGRVFWLGAAFMLLEVHNVSRLSLVFGTTWHVNAWVIAGILSVILLANHVRLHYGQAFPRATNIGLFVSLALAFVVPLEALTFSSRFLTGLLATAIMTAPIFFAGLVFADAFAETSSPGFALGWNVLGCVVGGLCENLSYLTGIPGMIPLAALFYALALSWPVPARQEAN